MYICICMQIYIYIYKYIYIYIKEREREREILGGSFQDLPFTLCRPQDCTAGGKSKCEEVGVRGQGLGLRA